MKRTRIVREEEEVPAATDVDPWDFYAQEGVTYRVYKGEDVSGPFCGSLVGPCDPEEIGRRWGGGAYYVEGWEGSGKTRKRAGCRRINIVGSVPEPSAEYAPDPRPIDVQAVATLQALAAKLDQIGASVQGLGAGGVDVKGLFTAALQFFGAQQAAVGRAYAGGHREALDFVRSVVPALTGAGQEEKPAPNALHDILEDPSRILEHPELLQTIRDLLGGAGAPEKG